MIEYKHEEAIELLQKNLETAETNLDQLESHLNFIRDQVNVTEVNMTRVYNYDVLQRRKQPEASK